jgi:hypothetical protein
VVAAIMLGSIGTSAARAESNQSCAQRGTTVAANQQVRVFEAGPSRRQKTFVCHLASRRETPLGDGFSGTARTDIIKLAVAGRYVGYATSSQYQDRPVTYVAFRVDARSGRSTSFAADVETGLNADTDDVPALVLTRTGILAYVLESEEPRMYAVRTSRDARPLGKTAPDVFLAPTVDTGADIAPSSLAAGRDQIYWTRAGQAQVG